MLTTRLPSHPTLLLYNIIFHVYTEFAHLIKLLWNSRPGLPDSAVSPVTFKDKIAEFAKRFVGNRYVCMVHVCVCIW